MHTHQSWVVPIDTSVVVMNKRLSQDALLVVVGDGHLRLCLGHGVEFSSTPSCRFGCVAGKFVLDLLVVGVVVIWGKIEW